MSNKKVIGIDLGTGNSAVSVIEPDGKPKVIVNTEGNNTTPSVVFIKGDELKIGDAAKRGMIMHPKNTFSFVKRFMGANYDDPDVQKMISMATYDVVNENGKPRLRVDGKNYTPEQISSMIVKHLYEVAKNYYGTDCKDVVITCPAWFNDIQRNAVKTAGELAGLNVLRVINEPTAAIMSVNIEVEKGKDKVILVNDLGCGTEDVSVAEISETDEGRVIEILASNGDVFLGGQNYDDKIVQWILAEAKNEFGIDLSRDKDPMAYSRIVEAAEKAKIELSSSTQTQITLPYIAQKDGQPIALNYTLTRSNFERMTEDLTQRVVEIAKKALENSDRTLDELDSILLVGGSSRIPSVQEALKKAFNKPLIHSNFDEAVALGAAVQANIVAGNVNSDVVLLDVTPISLGIEVNGCEMQKMIEANTTIPAHYDQDFTTAVDNQPGVEIKVLQGERPMSVDNTVIGVFRLEGIMPAPRGVPKINVKFDIDANGILSVSATDKGTGLEQHITIQNPNALSKEEIERIKADAEKFAEADKKRKEEADTINGAEQEAYALRKTLEREELKDKINDDERKMLNEKIDALLEAAKSRNIDSINAKKQELVESWSPISEKIYGKNEPQGQPAGNPADMFQQAGFESQNEPANEETNSEKSSFDNGEVQEAEFEEVK